MEELAGRLPEEELCPAGEEEDRQESSQRGGIGPEQEGGRGGVPQTELEGRGDGRPEKDGHQGEKKSFFLIIGPCRLFCHVLPFGTMNDER